MLKRMEKQYEFDYIHFYSFVIYKYGHFSTISTFQSGCLTLLSMKCKLNLLDHSWPLFKSLYTVHAICKCYLKFRGFKNTNI